MRKQQQQPMVTKVQQSTSGDKTAKAVGP